MSYNSKHKSSEIEEILDSVEGKQDKLKVVEISTLTITDLKSEVVINLTDEQNSLLVYSDTVILMYFMFPYATFGSRCVLHYSLLSPGKSYTGITSRAFSLDKKGDNIFVKAVRDSTTKTLTISFSDIIVTKDSLKTINGTSLLGSGDIVISGGGGSSSGSGAYAEVNHGTSDTTFTLTPNTFHVWEEVSALTLTLGSETAGVANEFLFQFTSGATATSLTLPDDIKWTEELVIEPNRIYQISILKGLASVLSWENANTSSLIENHITYDEGNFMNGGTITFEYPTASEITFFLKHFSTGSLVVPQGSTQVSVPWHEPSAPLILSIIPTEDSIYKYILP